MQETGSLKKSNDDDVNNVDNNVADANAAAACKQNIQVGASTFVKIGIRIKFFFRLVWTDCLVFCTNFSRSMNSTVGFVYILLGGNLREQE